MTHVAPSVQRKPALVFSLMAQEPLKLKRKFNVFLPLALIVLFGFWAFILTTTTFNQLDPTERDPRSLTLNMVQLGSLMLPLLIGSYSLVISSIDRKNRMLTRLQSLGTSAKEIMLIKSVWVSLVAFFGIAAVILATVQASRSFNVPVLGNQLVVVVFALLMETVALVPLFLHLALRLKHPGWVVGIALIGSVLGSAGHMIPQAVAIFIPFTLVGALSPVGVQEDSLLDHVLSLSDLGIVIIVALVVATFSIVVVPRRFQDEL